MRNCFRWRVRPRHALILLLLLTTGCGASRSTITAAATPRPLTAAVPLPTVQVTVAAPATVTATATATPPPTATVTQAPVVVQGTLPPVVGTAVAVSAIPATPTPTIVASSAPVVVTAVAQTAGAGNEERRAGELQATQQSVAAGTPRAPTAPLTRATLNPTIRATAARPVLTMVPTPPRSPVPNLGTPRSLPAADGQLVRVGDRHLWMACKGDGGPTVVMDAGVNSGSQIWSLVFSGISTTTRTCVYDRAGLGRSDVIPRPRTSQEVVEDLHGLLVNAGIPAPYVLVAHSFGGLNVRLYQSRFPQEVVGMVLVDTVHEDRFAATARVLTPEQERMFEIGRMGNYEGLDFYESSRLVREIGPKLPDLPLVVIARGRAEPWPPGYPAEELERVWRRLQGDLANRAPQGRLVIAEGANHNIPGEQPQIIIDSTRRIVDQIRMRQR